MTAADRGTSPEETDPAVADARPRITDEAVARIRERVGMAVRQPESAFEYVTVDAMRNFARGIGDVNPLYRDAEYARTSVHGELVAHPTFLLYTGVPGPVAGDEGSSGDPLAGVHAFYSGEEVRWFRPIVAGDRFEYRGGLVSAELKPSRRGGQAVHEVRERVYRDDSGVVGVSRELLVRIERGASRARAGDGPRREIPHRYSADEMQRIDAAYEAEEIRGAEPRSWEDVAVGDVGTPLVKGPYTVTAYICFAEGTGPRNKFHRAHSDSYAYRMRHPRAFPYNDHGFPDTVARVHWDKELAIRAGLPETYDFGGERVAWLSHAVTNWMGDGGFLSRLKARMSGFCFVGDTVWIDLRVAAVGPPGSVRLDLRAVNQAGEVVASGDADVMLPLRGHARAELPPPGSVEAAGLVF